MLKYFDSSYVGTVDMENLGYSGTPINDRWYSNEELAGALHKAVAYAQQRQAFGGAIGRFQSIAFALADVAVAVENARNLTYKAAWLKQAGRPIVQAAAMAKLYATEAAVTATRVATQVFGGSGFIEETPVARFYRDAKILEIGEGTSEIQRLVISRGLGLPVG